MKKPNNDGMTLVEVLVAIVIIGIVSAGVLTIATTSSRLSISTNEKTYAVNCAQNISELWQWHIKYSDNSETQYSTFDKTLTAQLFTATDTATESSTQPFLLKKVTNSDNTIQYEIYFNGRWQQCKNDSVDYKYKVIIAQGEITTTTTTTAEKYGIKISAFRKGEKEPFLAY